MPQKKAVVLLRSQDVQVVRELRLLLSGLCDVQSVRDLRSMDDYCRENSEHLCAPLTLIAQGMGDEPAQFLKSARERYPTMRRVMVSDHEDLSTAINGLHTGAIDSLLHRPFDLADVATALRLQISQGRLPVDAKLSAR